MIPQPPPGQGPIDPADAFSPPPPPGGASAAPTTGGGPFTAFGQTGQGAQGMNPGTNPGANIGTAGPMNPAPTPQSPMTSMNPGPYRPSGPGYPGPAAGMSGMMSPGGMTGGPGMPGSMPGGMIPGGAMPGGPIGPIGPMMFAPPPQRRGGAGKTVFLVVLLILLGGSLLLNFILAGSLVGGSAGTLQTTLTEGKRDQKIAVVSLVGPIDGLNAARFDRYLTDAQNDQDVKAIVIEIDSPGGTVTASDEIYHRIKRFKSERPGVPVVVSMGSLATSGGYYAACGGDHVFAQRTTLTGNIGVLMPRWNVSKLMEKYGVEENTVVSTGAKYKNAGSMFKEEEPWETAYIQGIADHAFAQFKQVVGEGRSSKLKGNIDDIANGQVYVAQKAKDLGLIDDIGYLSDAVDYAAKTASPALDKPTVFRYQEPPTMMDLLLSEGGSDLAGVAKNARGGVTVNNGVNINVDTKFLEELNSSRPMYLHRWPSGKAAD